MSHPMVPVVILAGGLGTRLGALGQSRPKCLVEVAGDPFVAHQLRYLRGQGVSSVLFCLGHLGEQVVEVVGDGSAFGLSVAYAFDGPRLLGTGGGIKQALPRLPQTFFVLYGDSYLECPFGPVLDAFRASGKRALMTVFANAERWDASNVEYADGRIVAYDKVHRTERMRHIDYGLGVLDRRAFDAVPENTPYDLALLYQAMLELGELASYEVTERFYEVGSPAGLAETRDYLSRLTPAERG
jgi:N-acetyl-alpha-D-muramate 1-phosphate uridylyltransferase